MNQKKNIFESSEQGIEKSVDSQSGSAEVEKLEQELKQCQAKAGMLDVIPTPVMAVDRDLNVTYMNIAGAKAMGSSQEDLIGKKCFNLFNTGHCNTEHCCVKKAMEQNGEFTGDTRAKLPGGETPIRYTGTPIKDDSGNIVGALEYVLDISKEAAITDEIDKLSQAAVEGKLDTRADADQFEGNYAQIVSGVNSVLDAVISPLNVAAEYIDRISKGDIPEKITEEYAGDFNEIKNNFNRCIDSINGLLSEGHKLVGEAVEGNLLERGSEDNFSGEYANLMSGMNTLVDTLVGHIDKIPAPFMIVDTDFSIQYMNHHGADVLGSKQEQLIGSKCYHNFNTSDCKNGKCALAKAMQSGETARSETVAKPGDSELYISYTGSPITNREGKIIGALEIVMDQTETKKAIDDANEKVNFLDNIPTPVMAVDTDFNISYMNPAGANALNRPQESVIGQKCFSLLNTGHCNSQDCRLKKAMEQDNEFTADTTARLPGGDLPIRYTGTPLKDESGKVVGGLEYVLDISKETSITQEVTKLSHAAIEGKLDTRADADQFEGNYADIVQGVNKVLDEVIAPLNVAAEYVDSIAKGDVPEKITEEYKGDFNEIKNNLNSLIDCMQEITYVAQEIASGNLTVEVEKRSEQDELMEALQTMVSDLSSIAVDVQTAAEQVATGSEQISSSAQKLSEGAQEQSSTIEEVSSSMEEMTSTVNQNAENAKETASIAEKAANDAQEGGSAVSETVGAMKSIAEKISIIEEIARQTNMLALNAAIEAARAGEQGKGFAVVASEVRKLAERSQNASKEISELTGNSVEKAEKAGNLIQEIVPGIQKTSELVQEINASSSEQAKGIQQVNDSVQQLDQVIQQSASSTEEMASTSEELSSQAEQLNNAAAFFKVEEEDVKPHKGVKKADSNKSGFKKKADAREKPEGKARPGVGKKTAKTGDKSFGARKEDRGVSGKKGMNLNLQDEEDNEFERY